MPRHRAGRPTPEHHHPDCHYDAGYCDGRICWQAAKADKNAYARLAKYERCWYCGLPCDGKCQDQPDEIGGQP